jgi:hypothetical protein
MGGFFEGQCKCKALIMQSNPAKKLIIILYQ